MAEKTDELAGQDNVVTHLRPTDYQQFLNGPDSGVPEREQDFWQKVDKQGKVITPWIIRHPAVQKLARLFGVTEQVVEWPLWDPKEMRYTCRVIVAGYNPLTCPECGLHLSANYPAPPETTEIGELNAANAGHVGRQYPQSIAYKRAYDRAVLRHLGMFTCYGDTEAPGFTQGADYEAETQAQHAPVPTVKVTKAEWAKQPEEVRELVQTLMGKHHVKRSVIDDWHVACNGDAPTLLAHLQTKLAEVDSPPAGE